ncbi:MAG: tetratricopeptide repeat protein [Sphingobacteriales bacterium]|nr:tetratricopeptide repeat protein [Sphingobacteriales bacterium]
MQKGQIALGAGALILAAALYFGGKTTSKKENVTIPNAQSVSFEAYQKSRENALEAMNREKLGGLVSTLKVPENDTAARKKACIQLSEFWKEQHNPALAAYYIYQYAQIDQTKPAFENAGDALLSIYKSGSDSIISNNLITFALRSYEEAVRLDGSDVELKIKLADVYVQGSQEPMKGIGLLRRLSDSLPDNIPVLLALGRLSIQSGQYDKAKERLQKVLKLSPQNTEAMYFLAITEAQLGHTEEAIRMFEMCKELVGNKDFDKEIDEVVKNLKSKKV